MGDINFAGRDFTKPSPDFVANSKLCPFSSRPCGQECKLYRYKPKQVGFECPFQELVPISYALRPQQLPRKNSD